MASVTQASTAGEARTPMGDPRGGSGGADEAFDISAVEPGLKVKTSSVVADAEIGVSGPEPTEPNSDSLPSLIVASSSGATITSSEVT